MTDDIDNDDDNRQTTKTHGSTTISTVTNQKATGHGIMPRLIRWDGKNLPSRLLRS